MCEIEQVELVLDLALSIEANEGKAGGFIVAAVRLAPRAPVHPVGDDLVVLAGIDAHVGEGPALPASLHVSPVVGGLRSEEHTSELQSRGHLVCRLLLEKKKNSIK